MIEEEDRKYNQHSTIRFKILYPIAQYVKITNS